MLCTFCGRPLAPGARFCGACGRPAEAPGPSFDLDYIEEALSASVRETVLLDKITGSEILRSPVFRFLAFVAIVPLAIEVFDNDIQGAPAQGWMETTTDQEFRWE